MKGYWVCIYEKIHSKGKLQEYAVKALKAVEKYSGRFLVRRQTNRVTEGFMSPRTVVVEFESFKKAEQCFDSKEYQDAHEILKGHCKRNHVIVEGS